MPGLHHVEIWVADAASARAEWGWLLERLGWRLDATWDGGFSWRADGVSLAFAESPNVVGDAHDRRRPGLNHLAFHGGSREEVDAIMAAAPARGWRPLYADRYPHAGGPDHYAGWIESATGFKAEVVASPSESGTAPER
ncbi:VOC family protein [Microbacterium betulae]|uniref:VOC family protein n=1 Tax=Microbacterium betulae TaxID=2981139 RepID=A0AA97FJK2_9MICO|nr:VOC family protein [Microbacterium sp. AB]WOF22717.1 VOC family protein [Microbacterium sp. AB]